MKPNKHTVKEALKSSSVAEQGFTDSHSPSTSLIFHLKVVTELKVAQGNSYRKQSTIVLHKSETLL